VVRRKKRRIKRDSPWDRVEREINGLFRDEERTSNYFFKKEEDAFRSEEREVNNLFGLRKLSPRYHRTSQRKKVSPSLQQALFRANRLCPLCKRAPTTEIHHIDGNHSNNNPKNLIALCYSCHKKADSRFIPLNRVKAEWKPPKYE